MTTASRPNYAFSQSSKTDSSRRKSCELCYQRKLRCNGNRPRCSNCVLYNATCSFETSQSQAKEQLEAGKKDENQDRLARLETLLAKVLNRVDVLESKKKELISEQDRSPLNLEDEITSFGVSSSAGLALPSNGTTQTTLAEALALVSDYFRDFNSYIPLFDESSFLQMVHDLYIVPNSQRDSTSQAALDIVLSLAHRTRAMQIHVSRPDATDVIEKEIRMANHHFKASQSIFSELTQREPVLLRIQALLGIIIASLGSSNYRTAAMLLPIAIRLAHGMWLHALDNQPSRASGKLHYASTLQQKRVFWIAYILDKQITMESDSPPMQDDSDFEVALPEQIPLDDAGVIYNADKSQALNYFRQRTEIAIIQGKIYRQMYSVAAARLSKEDRSHAAAELKIQLDAWLQKLAPDFRFEKVKGDFQLSNSTLVHLTMLHGAYLATLAKLDHVNSHDIAWIERVSTALDGDSGGRPAGFQIPLSWDSCVIESRTFLQLFMRLPRGNFFGIWAVMCSLATSILVLLVNAIGRTSQSMTRSDLNNVLAGLSLMGELADHASHEMLKRTNRYCQALQRQAQGALRKLSVTSAFSTSTSSAGVKRKFVGDDSTLEWEGIHTDQVFAQEGGQPQQDLTWPESAASLIVDPQHENLGGNIHVNEMSVSEPIQLDSYIGAWEEDGAGWSW